MVEEATRPEEQAENEITAMSDESVPSEEEEKEEPFASAKNIPRPRTCLYAPPAGEVSELTVSLVIGLEFAPSLTEVTRANEGESERKTPLMAVVQAVIANAGGTISIRDLAEQARRYWNRPFPTSPYTPEEFIYITVRDSDDLRVNE